VSKGGEEVQASPTTRQGRAGSACTRLVGSTNT